jgi:predicted secreted acid phosphatase
MSFRKSNDQFVSSAFQEFRSVAQAVEWCKKYLNLMHEIVTPSSVCCVLDIDGTVLHNNGNKALCNSHIHDLFRLCKSLGISVFIITARPDGPEQRRWTEDQLSQCGYPPHSYQALFMMPPEEVRKLRTNRGYNFSEYKYKAREAIVKNYGKNILLSVGDQWGDFLRLPSCPQSARESRISSVIDRLPTDRIYVGNLSDWTWMSLKLPSE